MPPSPPPTFTGRDPGAPPGGGFAGSAGAGPGPAGTNAPPTAASAPVGVAAELALIRASDQLLRDGKASEALAKLDEHARRFPAGALAEERSASRIFVLCALGRTTEAKSAAKAFLTSRPHSPHAARVRGSCGGAD